MPPLQVKDCPNDVYNRLRACAKKNNRSISSQVLTILEDFLNAFESGTLEAAKIPGQSRIIIYSRDGDPAIGERRRKVFERIRRSEPIPISEDRPRADIILAQIREEEMK